MQKMKTGKSTGGIWTNMENFVLLNFSYSELSDSIPQTEQKK